MASFRNFGRQNDTTLRVTHRTKRDYWGINTETDSVEFRFPRAESGDAHGQYALGGMYLNGDLVERDTAQAKYWLQLATDQGYKQAAGQLERLERTSKESPRAKLDLTDLHRPCSVTATFVSSS